MQAAVLALGWLERVERDIVHFITCTLHSDTLGAVLSAAQNKPVPVVLLVGLLALVARADRRTAIHALLAAGAAWGSAMLVADLMWHTIPRERPTQAYETVLRTPEELATCAGHPEALALRGVGSTSRSFPSRHGLTVGVFVTVLWRARRWAGLAALAYGIVVAVGRVYVGKHWPSDVLVGIAIGAVLAWAWWRLVPRIFPRLAPAPAPPPAPPTPPATHPPDAAAHQG
jgi:membrane-associated phospholipid phosphatase